MGLGVGLGLGLELELGFGLGLWLGLGFGLEFELGLTWRRPMAHVSQTTSGAIMVIAKHSLPSTKPNSSMGRGWSTGVG